MQYGSRQMPEGHPGMIAALTVGGLGLMGMIAAALIQRRAMADLGGRLSDEITVGARRSYAAGAVDVLDRRLELDQEAVTHQRHTEID